MGIPERCAELRLHFGLSARAFSTRLGISYNLWCQYESGRKEPSMRTLQALAAHGINTDWLVAGRGLMQIASGSGDATSQSEGFRSILDEITSRLRAHGGNRFDLWSQLVTSTGKHPDGATIQDLAASIGRAPDDAEMAKELAFLQREGIIAVSRGIYRLIRVSYTHNANDLDMQALLAVRDLMGLIVPAVRASWFDGKLIRLTDIEVSEAVLGRTKDLVNRIRQLNAEAASSISASESRKLRLIFAYAVTQS